LTTFAKVRNWSVSGLGFAAESGRWPPGRKAVAVDVSEGWLADHPSS